MIFSTILFFSSFQRIFSNEIKVINEVNIEGININNQNNYKYNQKVLLDSLPYDYNSLEPYINELTLRTHHDKHHAKYVSNAQIILKQNELENENIVSIIKQSYGKNQALYNNAAQSFNHDFYWRCMKPNGGGLPSEKFLKLIEESFGSYQNFHTELSNAANTVFGSGWAWLVWSTNDSKLQVIKTSNADSPFTYSTSNELIPLLTIDVWEHAYYLNYQNMRTTYVEIFLEKLVNWEFVEAQLPVLSYKE